MYYEIVYARARSIIHPYATAISSMEELLCFEKPSGPKKSQQQISRQPTRGIRGTKVNTAIHFLMRLQYTRACYSINSLAATHIQLADLSANRPSSFLRYEARRAAV